MEIIPAVDIRGRRCVRLYQGDYSQEMVFSDDPVEVALRWQSMGAPRLHLVDLDGAAEGEPKNLDIVKEIANALWISTQLGGGIRSIEALKQVLEAGVDRVILGTGAVEDASLVKEACSKFGDAIIVGLDVRDGRVATHGWREETDITSIELVGRVSEFGVRRFIYTDISRDGTLTEPNFDGVAELVATTNLPIIVAGGISSISHLQKMSHLGVEGCIVGKALYTGDISLKRALALVR